MKACGRGVEKSPQQERQEGEEDPNANSNKEGEEDTSIINKLRVKTTPQQTATKGLKKTPPPQQQKQGEEDDTAKSKNEVNRQANSHRR